jgi:glc operon protein GlcG
MAKALPACGEKDMKPTVKVAPIVAWLLLFAGVAPAQVANKKSLTLEGAAKVIAAAEVEARNTGGTAVIAVVDDGGNLMALQRLDGTFAAGANISIGKARTAVQFKKPTKFFEDVIKNGRTAMVTVDFTPLQGGVPIIYEGEVIGGVGVSGAANAQEDEAVAIAGAKAITEPQQSLIGPRIDYFDRGKVDAAFSKGAVLFDGSDGRNYMVHASRRDGPGMAEVHTLDADIIYVLGGNADMITGGTVQAPREIAANEIRGDAIVGGDERHLAKGDVIIVPHGIPHWFRQVDAPFTYYVVKVR